MDSFTWESHVRKCFFAHVRNVGGCRSSIGILRTSLIASIMLTEISFGEVDNAIFGLSNCNLLWNKCFKFDPPSPHMEFGYSPLVGLFHSRTLNTKINRIHYRIYPADSAKMMLKELVLYCIIQIKLSTTRYLSLFYILLYLLLFFSFHILVWHYLSLLINLLRQNVFF